MSNSSSNELIDFISRNQILNPTVLDEMSDRLKELDSADKLADELVVSGHLSKYQKEHLLSGQGEKLVFGPYRLVEPLGEGGMGMVFKGWHSRLDRYVALKFIHPQFLTARPEVIKRFQREARAIAQLQHPNIVILYDADEIDGTPFIAMEFVNGVSLSSMVRRDRRLGITESCEYVRQTALGLQHAADCGLVHRDIKPANILVSQNKLAARSGQPAEGPNPRTLVTIRDREQAKDKRGLERPRQGLGTIKILDMGLARLRQSLSQNPNTDVSWSALTEMGGVLGTPDFISPEQARDPSTVDIRADLYSLGCTFYYILSGQVPFPEGTGVEKMIKHQLDKPRDINELRAGIPSEVARVVNRLMAKKADERYQSPQELADALESYLVLLSHPAGSALLATAFCSTPAERAPLLSAYEAESSASSGGDAEFQSLEKQINFPSESTLESIKRFDSPPAAGVPDVRSGSSSGSSSSSLSKNVVQPQAELRGHNSVVSAVALTSDGRFAATGDVDGKIRVWDLAASEPTEVGRLMRPSEIQAITFAPRDPELIAFGEVQNGNAALCRWDWPVNRLVPWNEFGKSNQFGIGCVEFAADGAMIAAGVGPQAIVGQVNKREAGRWRVFKNQGAALQTLAISPDHAFLATASHNSVRCFDLNKHRWRGNSGVEVKTDAASIATMSFSPDGRWLAMGALDGRVILWDFADESGSVIELPGHSSGVVRVQFTSDGGGLVSIATNGDVFFWEGTSAHVNREFRINLKMAYRVALSIDSMRLVAGYSNGNIAFWNLASSADLPTRAAPGRTQSSASNHRSKIQK
jgi:serine/threonine-protein kinase